MSYKAHILTLYPEIFPGPLAVSLVGKALVEKKWQLDIVNIREFGIGKHRAVDEKPAGGGAGMVIRADVVSSAIESIGEVSYPKILLSASGEPFTQKLAGELAAESGIVLVAGRFEGVDERVVAGCDLRPISIGDYVLAGGEVAAMVMLESIIRLIPGVLGNESSILEESFSSGMLEYPQYTKPDIWRGLEIPAILKSGNHEKIAKWRQQMAQEVTKARRPDLLKKK